MDRGFQHEEHLQMHRVCTTLNSEDVRVHIKSSSQVSEETESDQFRNVIVFSQRFKSS